MFECSGLSTGDAGQLRVCEKTNLLLVELNTVSCSRRSAMETGPWTGQGCSAPWMYHSVAGQDTLLEKQSTSDFSPSWHRPRPRALQDSTNWPNPQVLPPRWGPLRYEGHWFLGKEFYRATSSPKPQKQYSPAYEGLYPTSRRDWTCGGLRIEKKGSGGFPANCRWNQDVLAKTEVDLFARAPPSYEAHMLLRLRAGQGPRKENWLSPPPYISPPSYEASHRTVKPHLPQLQATGKEVLAKKPVQEAPKKSRNRIEASELGVLTHNLGKKVGRCQAKMPGSWSYLSEAQTWGGSKMPPGRAESSYCLVSSWDRSPLHHSHTLPRTSRKHKKIGEPCQPFQNGSLQHTLPASWGFSHAGGWPKPPGNGCKGAVKKSRDCLPRWKEPSHTRKQGGHQAPKATSQRHGGLFVIDATCVVIQAHYIPPPQMEHVRYLGWEEPDTTVKAVPPFCSLPPVSMEERAARILGLSLSELGFPETDGKLEGPGIIGHKARRSLASKVDIPREKYGKEQPSRASSEPASPPGKPLPTATPSSCHIGPLEQSLDCPSENGSTAAPCQESNCLPQGKEEEEDPVFPTESRSYVRDLKAAMLRIRRHTAPDSDTDEELEKDYLPVSGQPARRGRLNEGAISYSSSSSLDSSGSNATVVPGIGTPALQKGSSLA